MKFLVLQHIDCEGPGEIGPLMNSANISLDVVKLNHGERAPGLSQYQAMLVMGGPMNVYEEDKYPFLREEDELIKEAINKNMPYLGICLGSQLLAKALGAKVRPNYTKEIGFMSVYLTDDAREDKLFQHINKHLPVFQWHGDTFEIPQGAIKLATSSTCQNQAFRYRNLYALQFHMEVTSEMVRQWAIEYKEELYSLGKNATEEVLPSDLEWQTANLKVTGRMLFNNFLDIVKNNIR